MSFEVQDFQADVVDASHRQPVLIDFWAPWCGPCRVLGPVLEKLAREQSDQWTLAKVNTDEHPEWSAQYGIRGIPAVKLMVEGRVVDEFTGALPEYAVRQWLEQALPSEARRLVEQAEAVLGAGHRDEAEAMLRQALDSEPGNPQATLLLAQLVVFDDPERAEELAGAAAFAGPRFVQIQDAIQTVARLLRLRDQPGALPDEPGRDAYGAAIDALARRDFETALQRFIEVIQHDRYFDDDGARKACIAVFALLGEQHPATRTYRRLFDMSLY